MKLEIFEKSGLACLRVRVQVNSKESALKGVEQGNLKIALSEPAVEGRANKQLAKFLSDLLSVPKSRIRLSAGVRSRVKTVGFVGLSTAQLEAKLRNIL